MSKESDFEITITGKGAELAGEVKLKHGRTLNEIALSNGYIDDIDDGVEFSFISRWGEWEEDLTDLSKKFPDTVISITVKNDEFEDGWVKMTFKNGEASDMPQEIYVVIAHDIASDLRSVIAFKDAGCISSELKRIAEHYRLDVNVDRFASVSELTEMPVWRAENNGVVDVFVVKTELH